MQPSAMATTGRKLFQLACMLAATGLVLCLDAPSARAEELYIVYASISGTQAVGWIAKEANLFAKQGLNVGLLFTGGGCANPQACGAGPSFQSFRFQPAERSQSGAGHQSEGV
jgi:hypothetical protein